MAAAAAAIGACALLSPRQGARTSPPVPAIPTVAATVAARDVPATVEGIQTAQEVSLRNTEHENCCSKSSLN